MLGSAVREATWVASVGPRLVKLAVALALVLGVATTG